jgi:hypothetical protein
MRRTSQGFPPIESTPAASLIALEAHKLAGNKRCLVRTGRMQMRHKRQLAGSTSSPANELFAY